MHAFNQSLKYDQRMHAADIRGSIAYAKALTLVGILTKDEQVKITDGLTTVGQEWEKGVVSSRSPGLPIVLLNKHFI
jgi:argininosuccinate lyase